jgi:carboxypeptidase Q
MGNRSLIYLVILVASAVASASPPPLPDHLAADAAAIIALSRNASAQGWNRLSLWVDSFGARVSGSQQLESALDFALDLMRKEGFDNVHDEPVMIPKWVRGEESLRMLSPYPKKMNFLGLGSSVGTGGTDINASVLLVHSFDELHARAADAAGKIVVYNYACDWSGRGGDFCYGQMVQYRYNGASEAAKVGAVASLVRSLTEYSLGTPHTGIQSYADGVKQIPAACITTEDADFLDRMQQRGVDVVLSLYMEAQNFPMVPSRNLVAEIAGSHYPEQVVMFGGHVDSWDVGQGAQDDGAGFMLSFQALSLIKQLGLKPLRTIRLVGWVCEVSAPLPFKQFPCLSHHSTLRPPPPSLSLSVCPPLQEFGGYGAEQYFKVHQAEAVNMSVAFESDLGVFTPEGLEFTGSDDAVAIMQQIMALAAPLNASRVVGGGGNADSGPWGSAGVPFGAPFTTNFDYFQFHHSYADMMTHVPLGPYDDAAAAWAIATYGIASLNDLLPRKSAPAALATSNRPRKV